jgi:hypothetical protein
MLKVLCCMENWENCGRREERSGEQALILMVAAAMACYLFGSTIGRA